MNHLRAFLVLVAHLLLLLLGTPGLDLMKPEDFDEPAEQEAARARHGPLLGALLVEIAWVDEHLRLPVYERVAPIQRPFRARQSWHLYRDGPDRVRRLEIRVDGRLVHRSADPAHAWGAAWLRNRRIRPVMQAVARRPGSPNRRGMVRAIIHAARRDFPEAGEITVTATRAPFPGTEAAPTHRYVAVAPDWAVVEERAPW
ncbi:MAG: hypothetical protein D6798_09755 [Deltaproteobacteria bacterium]|nr:MAG: hypothetical protein D6798_09755 [Deltaproteobacteria bacterium]